jgi:hypothetical protein
MFNGVKQYFGMRAIKKLRRLQDTKRHFHNFETAKSVALLYPYDTSVDAEIDRFMRFFAERQIKVQALAFIDDKVVPETYKAKLNKSVFCAEHLNWYNKPMVDLVEEFIRQPFDILIDFSPAPLFPLQYITALSRASMRVGKISYPGSPYEFILSIPENASHTFFIEQLQHYLLSIQIK